MDRRGISLSLLEGFETPLNRRVSDFELFLV